MQSKLLLDGAIAGAIAGGFSNLAVGFKEGIIGGAIGGILSNEISNRLTKAGFSQSSSYILAFAATALADIASLHTFGVTDIALIPYKIEDNLLFHHLVFYTALGLSMVGVSAYRKGYFNFFSNKINRINEAEQQISHQNS